MLIPTHMEKLHEAYTRSTSRRAKMQLLANVPRFLDSPIGFESRFWFRGQIGQLRNRCLHAVSQLVEQCVWPLLDQLIPIFLLIQIVSIRRRVD